MNAKHLSKFSISKKLALFGAIIAIAIIAAFSICATNQANAETNEVNATTPVWKVNGKNCHYEYTSRVTMEDGDGDFSGTVDILAYTNMRTAFTQSSNFYFKVSSDNKSIAITFLDSSYNKMGLMKIYEKQLQTSNSGRFWTINGVSIIQGQSETIQKEDAYKVSLSSPLGEDPDFGINIAGHVADADNPWQPVAGAFVQYYHRTLWGDIPVPEMNTFTDWFGHYTLEGIEDDMLPGVVKVFRYGYEVGESAPIWFVPEGIDTIYRFVEMAPSEPPVPPTPPDPPVPPVPPQPDPPQPVPPTPVPPTPTPVDPGGNIAQTSDSAGLALAIAGVLALCGACAFGACAKRRKFDK